MTFFIRSNREYMGSTAKDTFHHPKVFPCHLGVELYEVRGGTAKSRGTAKRLFRF
jgi:hypothetical protein